MSALPVTFDVMEFFRSKREHARLLRPGEVIPSELEAAFDLLGQLDPDWVWVLDCAGTIKGVLVASPAHGVAMIWRISIAKDASNMALVRILRRFLKDCRKRGIRGLLTAVSPNRDSEKRLASIMVHAGCRQLEGDLVMVVGKLPRENI
jgi:hypothetical protein